MLCDNLGKFLYHQHFQILAMSASQWPSIDLGPSPILEEGGNEEMKVSFQEF